MSSFGRGFCGFLELGMGRVAAAGGVEAGPARADCGVDAAQSGYVGDALFKALAAANGDGRSNGAKWVRGRCRAVFPCRWFMVWLRRSGENRSPSQRVDSGESRNDGKTGGMTENRNDGKIGMTVHMTTRPGFRLSPE